LNSGEREASGAGCMTPEGNLSMLAKQKNHKPAEKMTAVWCHLCFKGTTTAFWERHLTPEKQESLSLNIFLKNS
jgi:hypothetical protein